MAIYEVPFAVYERLASAKMNAFKDNINAHTHNGSYGVKVLFANLDGYLANAQLQDSTIDGAKLIDYSVKPIKLENYTIDMYKINNNVASTSSLKLNNNGYAYYAP